ncbi:phosphatidylglycerophosphatase A [Candidatus Latescibacterota bacterium]
MNNQKERVIDFAAKIISSIFYAGYFPFASGTFGSGLIVVLYFFLPGSMNLNAVAISLPIVFFIGVWSSSRCETFWGKDSGKIVIDEIAGMLATLLFIPLNLKIVIVGFFLFRAFDIFKPFPVRNMEGLPRGWGVMTDDLLAGVYSNLVLRIFIFMVPWVS